MYTFFDSPGMYLTENEPKSKEYEIARFAVILIKSDSYVWFTQTRYHTSTVQFQTGSVSQVYSFHTRQEN